jgi:2-oxoglutarate ferredoxin oxidoreductase subunit alpha
MDRLLRKLETAKQHLPQPIVQTVKGAAVGIIAYGSSHPAVEESRVQLQKEYTVESSYLRIGALPFTDQLKEFFSECQRIYVVEQNRDGQMADLLRMEFVEEASKIRKVRHYDGLPIDARFITDSIVELEGLNEERS